MYQPGGLGGLRIGRRRAPLRNLRCRNRLGGYGLVGRAFCCAFGGGQFAGIVRAGIQGSRAVARCGEYICAGS